MVDKSMSGRQIKMLQYLVWILLTFLTVATAWNMEQMYALKGNLPETYVRLERYQCDQDTIRGTLVRIDDKLDRLIERHAKEAR